jgi:hypothetical protein
MENLLHCITTRANRQHSRLWQLQRAVREAKGKQPSPRATQVWLHNQDAYTFHKPVKKRFHRNPYSVNIVMDVWEDDLQDVQNLRTYNDSYKFLLKVIDISKFLHAVPSIIKLVPLSHRRFSPSYRIKYIIHRTKDVPSYCGQIEVKNS